MRQHPSRSQRDCNYLTLSVASSPDRILLHSDIALSTDIIFHCQVLREDATVILYHVILATT